MMYRQPAIASSKVIAKSVRILKFKKSEFIQNSDVHQTWPVHEN